MRTVSLFFLLSLLSVAYCKCYGLYSKCKDRAQYSSQLHIKGGIPKHQDYVFNIFNEECTSIMASVLRHKILECESVKPRVFNCNSTFAQETYAPCTSFFGDKYANVMKHDCIVNGTDVFLQYKNEIGKKEKLTIELDEKGAPVHKDWYPVNGKCEWRYEIDGLWSSLVITLTVIIGVFLIARRNATRQKLGESLVADPASV
ncbi:hypothetical protein AV274_6348 [Blastocystis sp. ATCC 50177/Nand II]|uniref:Transmembrane protein n=1 Tax=Blastocystis sp. subtype 1 (strain ATCC 50177 / NandII) TaxID=478820 RepID=A0A196S7J3_BLAHN|nr:hypothetical protein AV274_6348 [Blastocystis sp. ATCC 50177/Nand II]